MDSDIDRYRPYSYSFYLFPNGLTSWTKVNVYEDKQSGFDTDFELAERKDKEKEICNR